MNKRNPTERFLVFCLLWLGIAFSAVEAQISEGGLPRSFAYPSLRSQPSVQEIPIRFSTEDLKTVDAWQVSQGAPLAVSILIPVDFSIDKSGEWIELPDGQKVWRLSIHAPEAIALMLYYSDFYIPEGGKLFIYNSDKSHLLGAYTSATNPPVPEFATEFIAGDELILEYEAAPSGERPQLHIDRIGYGYNHLSVSYRGEETGPGTSGACMVNINCEEGEEWQTEQKGICKMIQVIGPKAFICSGSLMNNTAKDRKPYVLSAFHCSENITTGQTASVADMNQWIFYFHFEHTRCDNASPAYQPKTMVGCTLRVSIPIAQGSDGLLVELNQAIPDRYDVFFNGWDRRNTSPASGVGIHHPSGDYMKISTYGNVPVESVTWSDTSSKQTGARNAHWNVIFDETTNGHGITEGGSSGSPLFNENKLVVGTLSGGSSSCDEPDGLNLYGKLFYHWNKYSEAETGRMDIWLDPLQSGVSVLGGLSQSGVESSTNEYKAPTDATVSFVSGNALLKWKTPVYTQTIGWIITDRVGYELSNTGEPFYFGQRWDKDDLQDIHRKTLVAVHFIPAGGVTYELFIRQGLRTYTQAIDQVTVDQLNMVELTVPFVIDAHQELVVAFYAKQYDASIYPARMEEGPAIQGKGNIYSIDGTTWQQVDRDANFLIKAVISSEEGVLTTAADLGSATSLLSDKSIRVTDVRSSDITTTVAASEPITAFPEVTGYKIYRDNVEQVSLSASQHTYTDQNIPSDSYLYEISALYGTNESKRTTAKAEGTVEITSIATEKIEITPTVFREQIRIVSPAPVNWLEIYSADGKLVRKINRPSSVVSTSSLSQGAYIFRLATADEVKTFRGIKY